MVPCIFIDNTSDMDPEEGTETLFWRVYVSDEPGGATLPTFLEYDSIFEEFTPAQQYADDLKKQFPDLENVGWI